MAFAFFCWRIWVPSPWRDEAASVVAARRNVTDLAESLRHVDAVHGLYYFLVHPILLVWPSVTALRIVSALAVAATAGLLVILGRRLATPRVGLAAGLILVASPMASRYAQEARPFALVALLTTVSTLLLCRALDRGIEADSMSDWAIYGLSLSFTVLLDVLGILILIGHFTLVAFKVHAAAQTRNPRTRTLARRWTVACVAALLAVAPFVLFASQQSAQVAWRGEPGVHELIEALTEPFGELWIPALLAALVLGILLTPWRSVIQTQAAFTGFATGVAPVAVLWIVTKSFDGTHSLFDPRYLVFALPGTALLLASAAEIHIPSRLFPRTSSITVGLVVPVVALAVAGAPAQSQVRDESTGHAEDMRGVADVIRGHADPGDGVIYLPGYLRIFGEYYSGSFGHLDDLAASGRSSSTLVGSGAAARQLEEALDQHDRVWVIASVAGVEASATSAADAAKFAALNRDFAPTWNARVPFFEVWLWG